MNLGESPEEILRNLIHELRQPLGAIETCAYVLRRSLGNVSPQADRQIRAMEAQVALTASLLSSACAQFTRSGAPRTAVDSLEAANSRTAGVR